MMTRTEIEALTAERQERRMTQAAASRRTWLARRRRRVEASRRSLDALAASLAPAAPFPLGPATDTSRPGGAAGVVVRTSAPAAPLGEALTASPGR